ncbi:MAG: hypothetical protein Q4C06_04285 [Bacillota bacterium]|nr:hypothetical protein [Bacillota bacterium]
MNKKAFAVISCMIFILVAAVGCSNKAPAPETPDTEVPVVEAAEPTTPPAEEDLLELYDYAAALYTEIGKMDFAVDKEASIIQDDTTYYKIVDERFDSYDTFKAHLMQVFTANMVNTELLRETRFIEGKDGYLYAAEGSSGTPFYAGYCLGEPVIGEDIITVPMTAYFTADDSPYTEERFSEVPDNPEDFRTEEYEFTLLPEDGIWKFDIFRVFY